MSRFPGVKTLSMLSMVWLYEATRKMAADRTSPAGGRGKLQRTIASFWSGSAASTIVSSDVQGLNSEASTDEVSTTDMYTVHVEDGNISSVDEGANELSVPCPNGSSSNRLKAGNSRAFKDDWELEYLLV